jgi:hypothetical protein
MTCSSVSHLSWLGNVVPVLAIGQAIAAAYFWRRRLPLSRFLPAAVVVVALVWGALYYAPFESTATIDLPKSPEAAACDDSSNSKNYVIDIVAAAITLLLAAGLTQLLLITTRRVLERREP